MTELIKLKKGMILRCIDGVTLYWSNRSGYTTREWTAGKAYRVKSDKDGNIYVANDMRLCAFLTEVEDGVGWQVFPAFKDLEKKIKDRFMYQSFARMAGEGETQEEIAEELYFFSISSAQYFPEKMIFTKEEVESDGA